MKLNKLFTQGLKTVEHIDAHHTDFIKSLRKVDDELLDIQIELTTKGETANV